MIRIALWSHASVLHFLLTGAAALALLFLAFLGALFSARCAWRRRRRWADTLRRGLGISVKPEDADDAQQPDTRTVAPAGEVFGPLARYGQYRTPLPKRIPGRPEVRAVTVSEDEYARLMLRDIEFELFQAAARRALDGIDRAMDAASEDPDA